MPVKAGTVQALNWVFDSTDLVYIRQTQGTASTSAASSIVSLSSVSGPVVIRSSAADHMVTLYQSTYGALAVDVHNSTIGDLLASVQQNSTVWEVQVSGVSGRIRTQNSSIADFLATVRQNSTVWVTQAGEITARVRAQNSTITDFLALVQQNSTVWSIQASGNVTDNVRAQNSTIGDMRMLVAPDSSNATGFFSARISDGSTYVDDSTARVLRAGLFGRTSTLAIEASTSMASTNTSTKTALVVRHAGMFDSTSRHQTITSSGSFGMLNDDSLYVYALQIRASTQSGEAARFNITSVTDTSVSYFLMTQSTADPELVINLSVQPPAYLFRVSTNMALQCNKTGFTYNFCAWRE